MILINLGFRQKPKFVKICVGFVKFAKVPKVVKTKVARYPKVWKKPKFTKITKLAKSSVLSVKRYLHNLIHLVVLIEICIVLYFCMFSILTEHLAECERFKYFQSAKWSKVYQVHFLGCPFCTCQM